MRKLAISYRDEVGGVLETIKDFDEETQTPLDEVISFCSGKAYFNDKEIDINDIVNIGIIEEG